MLNVIDKVRLKIFRLSINDTANDTSKIKQLVSGPIKNEIFH